MMSQITVRSNRKWFAALPAALFALSIAFLAAGCLTMTPSLPPMDLSEAGWTVHQGQAVWHPARGAAVLVGELLVATHSDGRAFAQFTKSPLPIVVAQITTNSWQIHFVPENRSFSGRGNPPPRLIWLHLLRCLTGAEPLPAFTWRRQADNRWSLENRSSGELLEGYFAP